jgi:hypothetical protein
MPANPEIELAAGAHDNNTSETLKQRLRIASQKAGGNQGDPDSSKNANTTVSKTATHATRSAAANRAQSREGINSTIRDANRVLFQKMMVMVGNEIKGLGNLKGIINEQQSTIYE